MTTIFHDISWSAMEIDGIEFNIDGIDFNFLTIDDKGYCTNCTISYRAKDPRGGFESNVHVDPTISVLFS